MTRLFLRQALAKLLSNRQRFYLLFLRARFDCETYVISSLSCPAPSCTTAGCIIPPRTASVPYPFSVYTDECWKRNHTISPLTRLCLPSQANVSTPAVNSTRMVWPSDGVHTAPIAGQSALLYGASLWHSALCGGEQCMQKITASRWAPVHGVGGTVTRPRPRPAHSRIATHGLQQDGIGPT